jgi:hypothetical protein
VQKRHSKSLAKPATSAFSLLDEDKSKLEEVRRRAAVLGSTLNKSETVRLSLSAMDLLTDAEFKTLLERLHRLRPGRA